MWEINNLAQFLSFLYSVVLGTIYALVYDVFKSVRIKISCSVAGIFFQDIIYSLLCAVGCYVFLIAVAAGEVRAFVLFGIAVGFIVWRLTLSGISVFIFSKIIGLLYIAYSKFTGLLNGFFGLVERLSRNLFKKVAKKLKLLRKPLKKA